MPTARSATSLRRWADGGRRGHVRPGCRGPGGKRAADRQHPAGHDDPQHRAAAGQRWAVGAVRGSWAQLLAKEGEYAQIRLPSGEVRLVDVRCMATIGQVGNTEHGNITLGKAGRKRWLGIRPTVRGSAMNPHRHPHGGGEGTLAHRDASAQDALGQTHPWATRLGATSRPTSSSSPGEGRGNSCTMPRQLTMCIEPGMCMERR